MKRLLKYLYAILAGAVGVFFIMFKSRRRIEAVAEAKAEARVKQAESTRRVEASREAVERYENIKIDPAAPVEAVKAAEAQAQDRLQEQHDRLMERVRGARGN